MQELARTQGIWQQPAAYEVNLRQEAMSGEPGLLIMACLTVREYSDTPKSTVVLRNLGVWTGMLLFSVSFYYGLARLVMWAASLWDLTTIEKIAAKLDEIASRASTRRDVGQLVDALRGAVSTIAKLGALPTEMTPEERLRLCYDAMERIAQELGA
jgi:hypothetical protein